MRHLRITFGNTAVDFYLKDGSLLATVKGKSYTMSREVEAPGFIDPADDLPQELQKQIVTMATNYFGRKK